MPTPQSIEEAERQGYEIKKLSVGEARKLIDSSTEPGLEATVRDCSTIPPGRICWEGDCINGEKEVLYCDGTQGCTVYAKVRC